MRIVSLAAGIATIALCAVPALAGSDFHDPEKVRQGRFKHASIVVAGGKPHIVAVGEDGLWYFTREAGVWHRTRVTSFDPDPREETDDAPSIALDPADGSLTIAYVRREPYIFIHNCGSVELRYVTNRSGEWSDPQRIGRADGPVSSACLHSPSLAVRDGSLFIAASRSTGPKPLPPLIKYLTNVTGRWTVDQIRGDWPPSLVLDRDGHPNLAFLTLVEETDPVDPSVDGADFLVWWARGTSPTGDFVKEKVARVFAPAPIRAPLPSLALTPQDKPRIAWNHANGAHYAYRDAEGWHDSVVMPGSRKIALAIDADGAAHIAAADGSDGLWYGSGPQDGGAADFDSARVASGEVLGLGGIDLSASGKVHITFQRGSMRDRLWYVRSMP